MHGLGWKRECDPLPFKQFLNAQIDFLMNIHVFVIVTAQDIIRYFKIQAIRAIGGEMGAPESGVVHIFDYTSYKPWNFLQLVVDSIIGDTNREQDSPLCHCLIVAYS